jgi:hypothetical protein
MIHDAATERSYADREVAPLGTNSGEESLLEKLLVEYNFGDDAELSRVSRRLFVRDPAITCRVIAGVSPTWPRRVITGENVDELTEQSSGIVD